MQELSWKTICGYFPKRNRNSHKGTFGTLLCITGSNRMPGACALSTLAALRSGAGLVKVATTERNLPILASQIYEAVYLPMQTTETGEICWEKNAVVLQPALKQASAVLIGCHAGIAAKCGESSRMPTDYGCRWSKCPCFLHRYHAEAKTELDSDTASRRNGTSIRNDHCRSAGKSSTMCSRFLQAVFRHVGFERGWNNYSAGNDGNPESDWQSGHEPGRFWGCFSRYDCSFRCTGAFPVCRSVCRSISARSGR